MTEPADLPIVAIVGATASGKSALALDLAQRLGGEVVNTDSMQAYVGMDIGTAKLSVAERRGVPHHLLDIWPVGYDASVVEFRDRARTAVADCRARGVVPLLVGGSALYTRAILDEMDFPGTDPGVRARWEGELAERGPEALHALLAVRDPEAAAAIEPLNGRRIVRALEVGEITGRPFVARIPEPSYADPRTLQLGVDIPRPVVDERIATRVDLMWEAGLVEEVRGLGEELATSRTASRAIGYAQVLEHLAGECSEDDARERTVTATRRFVRRQHQWFGKDPRITWLSYDDPTRVDRAVDLVRGLVGST
ncbi:tRNA (adenosine(37)-N6)-dimethylallyltransferase MiaA [Alteromonas gracilis]